MGTPKSLPQLIDKDKELFWSKVNIKGPDDCWEWTSSLMSNVKGRDYGIFYTSRRDKNRAHRVAYFLAYGVDPGNLYVCHHCDNCRCVNPKHLFLGTHKDNMRDCVSKGRSNKPQGVLSGVVKLTEKNIRDIRESSEFDRILAEKFNITRGAVSVIRARKSWKHLPATIAEQQARKIQKVAYHQGTNNGQSKILENQVKYIRQSSKTSKELAAKFCVTVKTINDIKARRSWKHVK